MENKKVRVADYIAQRCTEAGSSHVFLVTGGGAMFLNDALSRKLKPVCFHHEQSAAIAAESYYRVTNKLAVLNVTTGPGGINALNGVYGAYVDSLAMLVISGQVKKETYLRSYSIPLRQLGDQEVDIVSMARPVVKYATTLFDPTKVKEVMDKAIYLATTGRPGPVWVDVPIDVQSTMIDPTELKGFDIDTLYDDIDVSENTRAEITNIQLEANIETIIEKLKNSKRPLLFVGAGIRLSGMHREFLELVDKLKIPVVTGWNAHDTLTNDNVYYAGRPGTVGDRAGNFAVQNADFLLVLGSRLNIRQISYNFKNFASRAWKVVVDVDRAELDKPTMNTDLKVHADLKEFIPALLSRLDSYHSIHSEYLNWCKERVTQYPTVLLEYKHKDDQLNPYMFIEDLFKCLNEDDVVVTGNGSACVITFQAANLKAGQRLFTNSGSASMGYDLPAAIGATIATGKRVICLAGDGSLMMNLQELQTLVGYNLPVKVIVLNNNGYHSIKQTQRAYFSDNIFGIDPSNGVSLPDFVKLGNALDIKSQRVTTIDQWRSDTIQHLLVNNDPALIEVMLDPEQMFSPKLAAKKLPDGSLLAPSLENMSPFLPDDEMKRNTL
jgi:acetolactate synthase-1/2/3 large subunit